MRAVVDLKRNARKLHKKKIRSLVTDPGVRSAVFDPCYLHPKVKSPRTLARVIKARAQAGWPASRWCER